MLNIKCCYLCKHFKKCKTVKLIIEKESGRNKKTDFSKLFCIEFERIKRMRNGKDRYNK